MATKRPPKTPRPEAPNSPSWYEKPALAPPPPHPRTFLVSLTAQGIRLALEPDGTLRCRAPKGTLSEELQAQIAHYKKDLLGLLSAQEPAFPCPSQVPHRFMSMANGRRCVQCNHREEEKL